MRVCHPKTYKQLRLPTPPRYEVVPFFFTVNSPTAGKDAADPTVEMVPSGKITNPARPLPEAMIIPKATKQMAVTNAEGEFQFVVPASAGALQAMVTYAGYATADN